MNKAYNDPEFNAVKMVKEDILTISKLDDFTSDWEAGQVGNGGGTGGGTGSDVPFIEI